MANTLKRLRTYFLTGLVMLAPITITVYLIWNFMEWADRWFVPLIPVKLNPETYLPYSVPGLGLAIGLALVTGVGFLAANFIGKAAIAWGERTIARLPMVRNIYLGLKQMLETLFSPEAHNFETVALIEFPRKGCWALALISKRAKGEIAEHAGQGDEVVTIFVPTTPNPTTGFLEFVTTSALIRLEMSVEDAVKAIVSVGLVVPQSPRNEGTIVDGAAPGSSSRDMKIEL